MSRRTRRIPAGIHDSQRSGAWERPTPRRIGEESRAAPAPLPVPRIWPALTAGIATAALGLAGLCLQGWGHARPGEPLTFAAVPLDGLAAVLTGASDGTGPGEVPVWRRLGFLILAVACFSAWKAVRKAVLAYRPGPVDVHEFVDATPQHDAPTHDLKSRFCQRLSETHIYPPYAGPADPPPENFLDVAGAVDPRSTHPAAMVLHMLPRIWPRIGYRVTGVLQRRTQAPGFGVSVTITSFLRGGRSAMTTQWGGTWDEAIDRAAYWVLATILPVTRLGRGAPWRNWCGRELPAELFAAYDRGKRLQDGRQLDEALRYYCEALRLDPFNVDLRMMVASVQEEMGLFLDALDTYQSALALREPNGWYDAHLWSTRADRLRHPCRHLIGTLRYLRRRPESQRLRYQYACTLAYTERLVRQWFKRDAHGEREAVRRQIRQRLERTFVDRYWPAVVPLATGPGTPSRIAETGARRWLRSALRGSPAATAVVFQLAAAQELYRLREDALLARLVPAARAELAHSEITRSTLLLLRDVWAPLRLGKAWHEWAPTGAVRPFEVGGPLAAWWRRGPRRRAGEIIRRWPCPTPVLEAAIGRTRRGHRRRLRCIDFYHAACAYAVALQGHLSAGRGRLTRPTPQVAQLADRAVGQLRAALACTESGIAADRLRRWILSSNPDLTPLRQLPDFGHFAEEVYPSLRPVVPRADKVINSRMSAYASELVIRGARLMEETWHQRMARAIGGDVYQLIRWLDLDVEIWRTLDRVARDHARYWRDRAEFIRLLRAAIDPARLAEAGFPPGVPRYDDVLLAGELGGAALGAELAGDGDIERLARRQIAGVDQRLEAIHRAVTGPAADGSLRIRQRLAGMGLRGEPLRGDDAAGICARQAGRWQRVAQGMQPEATKAGQAGHPKVARGVPAAPVPARRAPAL